MRVFLDTNVLVSAFAARGLCADLLEVVLADHDLVLGRNVLRELTKALPEKVWLSVPRAARVDPDDALVLGEAIRGRAECFVTGDGALLELPDVEGLQIRSPRQLWEALHSRT